MRKWILCLSCGLLLIARAQTKPTLEALAPAAAPLLARPLAALPADTGRFPLRYCTALPRADFAHWEEDYAAYNRFLTPEIRRTQVGLSTTDRDGVHTWLCVPAATTPVQLDTLTRIADPARLLGHWQSVAVRTIEHYDSAVISEQHIYRTMRLRPGEPERAELTLADGRLTWLAAHGSVDPLKKVASKKYALVSGRYLLVYGLLKSAGGVSQVGLDAQGRLILHSYAAFERKIPGRYQVYETVLNQTIFERAAN